MTLKEEDHAYGLGVKFRPTEVECVLYLMHKIVGDKLPWNGVVLDSFDPYDETQLPALFTAAETSDMFFFTMLKRKGSRAGNSKNVNRTVGNNKATWHGDQSWEVTYDRLGVIGTAHSFSYRENGSTNDRRFLITEYHLPLNTTLSYDPLKNPVLCRLRLNNSNRSKRKSSHQPQARTRSTKKPKSSDDHAITTNQDASSYTFHHQFPTTTTTTPPPPADDQYSCEQAPSANYSNQVADDDTYSLGDLDSFDDLDSLGFTFDEFDKIFQDDSTIFPV